ncbi:MAG: hypothetical protein ABSE54_02095 [Smithella sp.]|jgi:hypothetical protein
MAILEEALNCSRCIISVMGDHANEGVGAIFHRKTADIVQVGKTFWLMKSPKARPPQVQDLCKIIPTYAIFIKPSTKSGARPTTSSDRSKEYSPDRESWQKLPDGITPVTGRLDTSAAALVFDMMTTDVKGELDLWDYGDFSDAQTPLKFRLGCSTICAVRKDMTSHPGRIKSRYRGIVAVARLAQPYCVWLR